MRRVLILAALGLAAACNVPSAAGPAGVTPLPASPVALQPAPGAAILDAGAVGLPLVGEQDGITAAEAANEVPDAADALPLFDSWGWVVESRRTFARGAAQVRVSVLLTLRSDGAGAAFAFLSEEAAVPPLITAACPAGVTGTDECALGRGGGRVLVVGRVGAEVFELSALGVDAVPLASLQAARLRA